MPHFSRLLGLPVSAVFLCWALTGGLLLSTGCSSQKEDRWARARPKVVEVSGKVLLDEEPLAGARVHFFNKKNQTTAYATTNDRGRFVLTTFVQGDGATPGLHRVKIMKYEVISRAEPDADPLTSFQSQPPPEEKWFTPKRYANYDTSGLDANITEQNPEPITFQLAK